MRKNHGLFFKDFSVQQASEWAHPRPIGIYIQINFNTMDTS